MGDAGFAFPANHNDRIFGCNRSGELIPAHTPVDILYADRPLRLAEVPRHVPYLIRPVKRESAVLGVTLTDIPDDGWGEIQVSGVAQCKIAETNLYVKFVLAGDGELIPASYGWPVFSISAPKKVTFILLGGCCQNYIGTFAVVAQGDGYYCYDSGHPDSPVAGVTDVGDVPAGNIVPQNGRFSLFLWYDGENYHQSFSRPDRSFYGEVTLAELINNAPRQTWTQGFIHWAQWYLL
ncbi:MAG: hypothetical protein MJ033_01520 [Victivallaceae bacterium]|nr:hypothetical protein [Victivallaceae bacterium]